MTRTSNVRKFEANLPAYLNKHVEYRGQGTHFVFTLENITDIHLSEVKTLMYESNMNKSSLYLLIIIACIILTIAWINYMNISTATSIDKVKEVGIMKVAGAKNKQLFLLYLTESMLLNGVSILFSVLLILLLQPWFFQLVDRPGGLSTGNTYVKYMLPAGLLIVGTLVSGLYSAWLLSSLRPGFSFKNSYQNKNGKTSLRKLLVAFQFTASTALIGGTLIVWQQVNYMQHKDLGLNAEQLLIVRAPLTSSEEDFATRRESFKSEMTKYPEVQKVAGSYYIPGEEIRYKANYLRRDEKEGPQSFGINSGDADLIETFGYRIICGRNFSEDFTKDRDAVILNETGVHTLGYSTPEEILNQEILYEETYPRLVIGVIEDYHHMSARYDYEPLSISYDNTQMNYYAIRLNTSDITNTMKNIRLTWKTVFPEDPFDFFFMDEYFDRQYKDEIQFGKVFIIMAWLTIFIACLGLLGLALHSTKKRTKEIGVRKVLGSSVREIWKQLCTEFLKPILIAIGIALPITWFFMLKWLEGYSFRTNIAWWFWIIPGSLVLAISLISISLQVYKAANRNPVEALRYE